MHSLIEETVRCCQERRIYEARLFGIPFSELRCLMLFRGARYLTVTQMAEALAVAKSRITKIVSGLGTRGLVEQVGDPKDGRVRLISLTAKGQAVADKILSFQKEMHRNLLEEMTEQERRGLLVHLELLHTTMTGLKGRLKEAGGAQEGKGEGG